jgi:hypothetical protein
MAETIKPKTISFKDGRDLDRLDTLLKGTRIRNRMPDAIRGNRSKMTLWAIEYLTKLLDGGVDNLQSELFEPDSQEILVITEENKRLKAEIQQLREQLAQVTTVEDLDEESYDAAFMSIVMSNP